MPLVEKTGAGAPIPFMMWGDSRTRGFGSTAPTATSWAGRIASRLPPYFTTQINGVDGDTLFAHSSTAPLRAAFTASIAAFVAGAPKSVLILQYDYNDWHNGELASVYGSFLDAQLTSFAAGVPGLTTVVFASIDFQDYGTVNGTSGNTIQDFLTQQTNAVAAHAATSRLVLGKPMLPWSSTSGQWFDAVHPADAGYITIANAIAPQVETL